MDFNHFSAATVLSSFAYVSNMTNYYESFNGR